MGILVLWALATAGPAAAQGPPFSVYRDTAASAHADPDTIGSVAQMPVLRSCESPSEPVGTLLGSGTVTYTVTREGRIDPATLKVASVDGISEPGLFSAARRLLGNCRYRPARQAGEPVAVTVRHRVSFTTGTFAGTMTGPEGSELPVEEMPAVRRCDGLRSVSVSGTIRLSFVIGLNGWAEPSSVQVLAASNVTLRNAAPRIARRCQYAPARAHGEPIRIRVVQGYSFGRTR